MEDVEGVTSFSFFVELDLLDLALGVEEVRDAVGRGEHLGGGQLKVLPLERTGPPREAGERFAVLDDDVDVARLVDVRPFEGAARTIETSRLEVGTILRERHQAGEGVLERRTADHGHVVHRGEREVSRHDTGELLEIDELPLDGRDETGRARICADEEEVRIRLRGPLHAGVESLGHDGVITTGDVRQVQITDPDPDLDARALGELRKGLIVHGEGELGGNGTHV